MLQQQLHHANIAIPCCPLETSPITIRLHDGCQTQYKHSITGPLTVCAKRAAASWFAKIAATLTTNPPSTAAYTCLKLSRSNSKLAKMAEMGLKL